MNLSEGPFKNMNTAVNPKRQQMKLAAFQANRLLPSFKNLLLSCVNSALPPLYFFTLLIKNQLINKAPTR